MKRKNRILLFLIAINLFISTGPLRIFGDEKIQSGFGWSTKGGGKDVKEAVNEALERLKEKVEKPEMMFLFSTVGYDSKSLLDELKKRLPKKTKVYGGTSCLGVITSEGLHMGEEASLALLGVSSDRMSFGVGGSNIDDFSSPVSAAESAIKNAIVNSGEKGNKKPKLVFLTAAPGSEESLLDGIINIIGEEVPVIGGSSADNDISGKWCQFSNNEVFKNGISCAVLYTDLKIGWSYESGYLRTDQQSIITRASGRTIYEIEKSPAAEVYNEWSGGSLNDLMKTGGNLLDRTAFFPLAKVLKGDSGETYYLSIHPLSINMSEKSLSVFAEVKTGENISLLRGNWELLLNRAYSTPLKARSRGDINKENGIFGIYTFCAGTMLSIPKEELPKMPSLIKNVMGETPFVGVFTFGEQGYLPGAGNYHANLVTSMVVIGE